MALIEEIAQAALRRDSLRLRSLVQDLLRSGTDIAEIAEPQTDNQAVLAISAGILELLALRTNQQAPAWTTNIGPVSEPFYLLESAAHMKRLQQLCRQESPEPLRKRSFYAPPNYLSFA